MTRASPAGVHAVPSGPAAALADIDAIGPALDRHHLYHATRAELLRDLGRHDQAHAAEQRALHLATSPAQRDLLQRRLNGSAGP